MCKGRNNTPAQKRQRNEAKHCAFCGCLLHSNSKYKKATIDHFYPRINDPVTLNRGWNKVIVCKQCNLDKAGHMPEQYIAHLQKQIDKLTRIKNAVALYAEKLEGYYIMRDLI